MRHPIIKAIVGLFREHPASLEVFNVTTLIFHSFILLLHSSSDVVYLDDQFFGLPAHLLGFIVGTLAFFHLYALIVNRWLKSGSLRTLCIFWSAFYWTFWSVDSLQNDYYLIAAILIPLAVWMWKLFIGRGLMEWN